MKKAELIGAVLIWLVLLGTPAGVFAYQAYRANTAECQTINMRTYENGNPYPSPIRVKKGEPACIKLTSEDVTHGFIISDFNVNAGEIHAGKWTTIVFTPTESGTFNYVCTIVCSPMHSRVRGQIIVED
ncbi:MAG: cupredoxin domain-containing protein [Chloroflexi bacterium]|nr:cupredoxin domain-containing protein [Chloroflexota bacterium]